MAEIKYAPREVFEQILEWAVIPTFDLVVEYENQGVILVKRKIAPYKDQWALPGLRIFKGEDIDDVLVRIAKQELGLDIDSRKRVFLGQYVGRFKTEHRRQDLSTGYVVVSSGQEVRINSEHFSSFKLAKSLRDVPSNTGAMYKFYLERYFAMR